MKTIILAGGKGTRLKDLVSDVPKPMAPVARKPFLEYIVSSLKNQGLDEIIMSIGYKGDMIEAYFGDGSRFGTHIYYCRENVPLGTGGAIREALKFADASHCLVLNGDTYNRINFRDMETFHLSSALLMTIGLRVEDDAGRYGSVDIDGSGTVKGFHEKNNTGPGYVNCGAYIINRSVIDLCPENGKFSFEIDLLPHITGDRLKAFISEGFFVDIGIPETYRYINDHAHMLDDARPEKHVGGSTSQP
ncbi:MAG: nucleotidyltransferase family protein [Syntrophorhabdaceae bacterium]